MKLGAFETNNVYCMDALDFLRQLPEASVDLVVTSPPYDNLRTYNGYSFDFEAIARESYRVLKRGGVQVWVVGDSVVNGSETLTSFRQALFFKDVVGFNLHDTMIYQKNGASFPDATRYSNVFEYMFVLSKGTPAKVHLLEEPCRWAGASSFGNKSQRNTDGQLERYGKQTISATKPRDNVWIINGGFNYSTKDQFAFEHPAMFPEKLAERHILTWSNPGDIVLDYFGGSGTTAKMALHNGRQFLTCDISEAYCELMRKRLDAPYTLNMFNALPSLEHVTQE